MLKFALAGMAATAAVASSASAAIIVFTNEFVWDNYALANDAATATENFNALNGFYGSLNGTLAGVNWSAAASGGLYVGPSGGSQVLSTNNPGPMTLSFSGLAVQGVAGNVFGTDINFNVVPSIVQLSLQDGTTYIGFVDAATAFVGFYSTGAAITGVTISAQPLPGGTNSVYPSFDNLTVAVVPAPGALALVGLAGLASSRRRR